MKTFMANPDKMTENGMLSMQRELHWDDLLQKLQAY